ncbi:hypothetical protein R1sor_008182 [Riccia sorocarpa]|uniref:Uncharacterized protein n=1 Tax=Riccia sorocarpa TaxID=122646 RepID=A0ABD3HUA6_9MARC
MHYKSEEDGLSYCQNTFGVFVKIGEDVPVDHQAKHVFEVEPHSKVTEVEVFATDSPQPEFVTDSGVEEVGTWTYRFPVQGQRMDDPPEIEVSMFFGQAKMEVHVAALNFTNAEKTMSFDFDSRNIEKENELTSSLPPVLHHPNPLVLYECIVTMANIIAEDSQAVPEATAAEVQSSATQPSAGPQPTITTLSSDDDFGGIQPSANTEPSANQPHPRNTGVPPIPCENRRNTDQTRGTDHEEPEVLITGVRLRSRPPTRATTTTHNPGEVRITQHGQLIVEQDVDRRFWHISRLPLNGNPACSANITGPNPPRALCKTKIKSAGLKRPGFGIVAPSFAGYRRFNAIERPHQFWFCPETSCVGSRGSQDCRYQMPSVPDVMPILTGTKLSQVEVDFLTAKGFTLVHRFPAVAIPRTPTPTVVDIRINVDAYPQKIDAVPSSFRFNARGTKGCRRKSTPSDECNDRLQRAITTTMLRTEIWLYPQATVMGKGTRYVHMFSRLSPSIT